MEIRCSRCSRLGVAAAVQPVEEGLGLVCAGCGYINVVSVEAEKEAAQAREQETKELIARLLPEPGAGLRCRKCAHKLRGDDEFCARCGLSVAAAARFAEGEAPWEVAPPGKETELEQGRHLLASALERGEGIEAFVDFVIEAELMDFGIRELQHVLVEHPDHREAAQGLARLAMQLEQAAEVARSQAAVAVEAFPKEVQRVRQRFLMGALIFWGVILILLSLVFWGK